MSVRGTSRKKLALSESKRCSNVRMLQQFICVSELIHDFQLNYVYKRQFIKKNVIIMM
jgi:hypothetical protein